ncbi:MAG: 6-bladed beta-propeller [Tannerella sp.]|jgi:hypothetical protein|nr:6-bladed beta-propeller [Tannerella sp.]
MKKTVFISVITVALLTGCKGESAVRQEKVNGVEMPVCSLDKVSGTRTMPLSELVESCELIRFEDIDAAIFKARMTTVSEKYIGVSLRGGGSFKLFDRSGKYLCDVGSLGQGPGEYAIGTYDELIDDRNELVYLAAFMENGILVYSTSGQFLKKIKAPHRLNKPVMFLSEGILSVVHMPFGGEESLAIQFDADGNIVKQLKAPEHLVVHDYGNEIFYHRNTGEFDLLPTATDTLFHYDVKANRIVPVFVMEPPTKEDEFLSKIHNELKHGFLTTVMGKGLVYTDKKAKSASWVKIVNDFYGGIECNGNSLFFRNGWYTWNVEPLDLIDAIEKRLQESDCTDDDRTKLKELLSTIDANSANLLFLGKLK